MKQLNIYNNLVKLYNEDKFHIDFLDKVEELVPVSLIELYFKAIELSLEAPFDEEINEDYQVAIELFCKGLGFKFNKDGKLIYKEVE
jgi:hypothetical protein